MRVEATHFGQSKVGDAHVPLRVEENILRLEVAIDDLEVMEVVEGRADLCRVQPRARLGEAPRRLEVEEELAAVAVVHDEVELGGRLEGEAQVDEEWVVRVGEGAPLSPAHSGT